MPSLHSERASRDTEGSRHLPRAARLNLKNVRSQRNAEERRRSIDDPNSAGTDSNLNPQERKLILRILKSNWQAEMRGRETYATLAEREADPQRCMAFRALADAEQRHADLWAGRHSALGGSPRTVDCESAY